MRRSLHFVFLPLAALLLAASPPNSPAQKPRASSRPSKSKSAKLRELPHPPVSELINRILVDEARLETARRLSTLAIGPDEKEFADKALRLADHQLDLAFLVALRRAADNPEPPTPQVRELDATVKALQADVDDQQSAVDALKKQLAAAHVSKKQSLQQQLELEQAKLELATDELADAREDLINAGGDLKSQVERLQAEHQATEHGAPPPPASASAPSPASPGASATLLGNLRLWMALHSTRSQIEAAQADALEAVDSLRQRLAASEKEIAAQSPLAPSAAPSPAPQSKSAAAPPASGSVTLEMLLRQSRNQKILAGNKLRIRDMTDLAGAYSRWDAVEAAKQQTALRSLGYSLLWIALIVLAGIITNRILLRIFSRMTDDRRRRNTLRTLSRFGLQVVCLALILLVVLGPPSQLATLLAFAGAGLTVALKDFIVSFIGWFMLMGRNGVHAGDWVEINNVCGEVLEVNLFHTVLLETGNWNDPGHPTGRKVTFTNTYAIEGHYFNFTTSGQWLWDELEFLIPHGEHPNAVADAVLQMVTSETQANAQLAETEWSRLGGLSVSPSVSAAPVLSVRPSSSGVTGYIRYITRANERFQTRTRLYHLIVETLHARAPQV